MLQARLNAADPCSMLMSARFAGHTGSREGRRRLRGRNLQAEGGYEQVKLWRCCSTASPDFGFGFLRPFAMTHRRCLILPVR